jgi:glycosyltransferase involved in cell wall biosynthesis
MTDRIAILSMNPPSTIGGVERFVHFLKNGLSHRNIDIDVYDSSLLPKTTKTPVFSQQRYSYQIGKAFRKHHKAYDCIITNGMLGWNVHETPAIHVYHGTAAGVVAGMTGLQTPRKYLEAKYLCGLQEKLCGRDKTIVAVSSRTKQEIETAYRLPVHSVILNAVDEHFFKPLPDKHRIRDELNLPQDSFLGIFMDSTGLRKGKDTIEAISQKLPDDNQIVAVSRNTFPPSPNIIHRSNVPFELLPKLYNACDYLLFPSRYEGCSYAIIEAMACGLPSIISDVGHTTEIKTNSMLARLICTANNPDHYLKRIQAIQRDETLYKTVSKESRSFAKSHHSLSQFITQYHHLINEIISVHCWESTTTSINRS